MKWIVAAAAMAALVSPALAAKIDFGAATCADTKTWDQATAVTYLVWLDGYMSGKTDNTVMDTDETSRFAKELDEYCAADPSKKLLDITNEALQAE